MTAHPVGVTLHQLSSTNPPRHALTGEGGAAGQREALCGAYGVLWGPSTLRFDPGHPRACQGCAMAVVRAEASA